MRVFGHWPHQLLDHNDVPLWGVRVCVLCGFTLQGPRVSGSYWQPQSEDDMEEGDGAGLMADSSCFWSALHSVHIRHLLPDESGVELERRVESWEAVCFFFFPFFLMETSIWQGHGPSSFISICGLSLISCPPVYLPHLSAGRCLRYTNFMTDSSPIKKKEWVCNFLSHINTRFPVCLTARLSVTLSCCSALSLCDDRPILKCQPDPSCQRETLHSCSLPRWQTSPTLRF